MEKPIRVLNVVTRMDAAGIETLIMNFYRNIDRTKVQFDFLTHRSESGFYDEEIKELGGNIYCVPPINPLKHNKYIESLDSFFEATRSRYNIVHSHINTYSMYPLRSAKKAGIPIRIAHSHIANVPFGLKTPFRTYTKLRIKEFSTHNFACSKMAAKWLFGKEILTHNGFQIINNSIDAKKYLYNESIENKLKKEMGLDNKIILGHIGRFVNQKNHSFLIEVFKEVNRKNPNTVLILIGEGKLRSKIEKKITELNLQDSVILTGVKSNISELIQVMDAFVLPSLYEGLGIVAVEAQAAGVPCIVSQAVPSEAFITDNITSLSLKLNPEIWANEILEAVNHKKENTYGQIVNAGYDIREQTKKLEEFYLSVDNNYRG